MNMFTRSIDTSVTVCMKYLHSSISAALFCNFVTILQMVMTTEDMNRHGSEVRNVTTCCILTHLFITAIYSIRPIMWPFTSSSTSSQTVASDLTPTPGPSTQAVPASLATASTSTPTATAGQRLNIPSGNSQITPPSINAEEDKLTGDKWTDYKAAFEVCHPFPLLLF
jgi:hypothetical protein